MSARPACRRIALYGALAVLGLGAVPARAAAISLNPCSWPGLSQGCDAVGSVVSGVAGAVGGQVFDALTRWVAEGAAWLVRAVARGIEASTRVDLGAAWFQEHYRFMFAAGGLVLLPFLLLAVLQALLRQDAGVLARAAFLHLPAAMLLSGAAVAVTQGALATTDALTGELTGGIARDAGEFAGRLVPALTGPVPLLVGFLVGLFMALAALFVWVELLLRSAAIYVALMFLPLFLAAVVWPRASGWARRLGELLGALVLLKLVVVATLSLGLAAVAAGQSVSGVLAGAAIFCLAAFAPFALLWLIPVVGEVAHHQRQARGALAASSGAALGWQAARSRLMGVAPGGGTAPAGGARASGGGLGVLGGAGSGALAGRAPSRGTGAAGGGAGPSGPAGGVPPPAATPRGGGEPSGPGSGARSASAPAAPSSAPPRGESTGGSRPADQAAARPPARGTAGGPLGAPAPHPAPTPSPGAAEGPATPRPTDPARTPPATGGTAAPPEPPPTLPPLLGPDPPSPSPRPSPPPPAPEGGNG